MRRHGQRPQRHDPQAAAHEAGTIDREVPRDRAGSFDPQLVGKGQRRLDGLDRIVLGLYAHGMTVRDIRAHLAEVDDVEVSPDLISTITDAVLEEVRDWQTRPLDRVYPVIFLDAIVCTVRTDGVVGNKAAHLAVGVDTDGRTEVLGIWLEITEGAAVLAAGEERAQAPRRGRRAHCRLRRPHRPTGGGRGGLARGDRADLHRAPDPAPGCAGSTPRTVRRSPPSCG
jgi:transposase-like protein